MQFICSNSPFWPWTLETFDRTKRCAVVKLSKWDSILCSLQSTTMIVTTATRNHQIKLIEEKSQSRNKWKRVISMKRKIFTQNAGGSKTLNDCGGLKRIFFFFTWWKRFLKSISFPWHKLVFLSLPHVGLEKSMVCFAVSHKIKIGKVHNEQADRHSLAHT